MGGYEFKLILIEILFFWATIYIIKIYYNVVGRRPIFYHQGISQNCRESQKLEEEIVNTQRKWVHNSLVHTSGYQRLDKSNFISTYPTVETRRWKSGKDERWRILYGRIGLLLLPKEGAVEKGRSQSINYINRPFFEFGAKINPLKWYFTHIIHHSSSITFKRLDL